MCVSMIDSHVKKKPKKSKQKEELSLSLSLSLAVAERLFLVLSALLPTLREREERERGGHL